MHDYMPGDLDDTNLFHAMRESYIHTFKVRDQPPLHNGCRHVVMSMHNG